VKTFGPIPRGPRMPAIRALRNLRVEDCGLTLDLDFANVQACPPKSHPGFAVFGLSPKTSQRLLLS